MSKFIKTRLELYIVFSDLSLGIKDLIKSRKLYQQLEGWSYSLDGIPPVDEDLLKLGESVHIDVYGGKPVKTYC